MGSVLVAISHAAVIRGRVNRAANFLESQLVQIARLPEAEAQGRIADVLETCRQLLSATRALVDPQHCTDPALPAELDQLLDRLETELNAAPGNQPATLNKEHAQAVLALLRQCATTK